MKIHYHPASTTSRPVMLFAAEQGLDAELVLVDIFTGEHMREPYSQLNPNQLVPVLEDGDFKLTESSAILKYLADKIGSPAYPKDSKRCVHALAPLRERAALDVQQAPLGEGLRPYPSPGCTSEIAVHALSRKGRGRNNERRFLRRGINLFPSATHRQWRPAHRVRRSAPPGRAAGSAGT